MQNYEAITIREAALAHSKDINSFTRATKNGEEQGFNSVNKVLSDAQDIYEFLTQDSAVEDKPETDEHVVIPFPASSQWIDTSESIKPDIQAELKVVIADRDAQIRQTWNAAIDAVLDLQYENNLSLDDSVNVRAARTAIAALRKVDA